MEEGLSLTLRECGLFSNTLPTMRIGTWSGGRLPPRIQSDGCLLLPPVRRFFCVAMYTIVGVPGPPAPITSQQGRCHPPPKSLMVWPFEIRLSPVA